MLFSIIIPVYNVQNTLQRCLDSIKAQADQDYEVILIDDGSTDRSGDLCDEAAKTNDHFRVFHQENKGPAAARNCGLQAARGEYICFVDSDDFIAEDYLEQLALVIRESRPGAVFFGYHLTDKVGKIVKSIVPDQLAGNRMELLETLSDRDLFGYTWIKCFSKDAAEGIEFPEDMRLFEDEVFACRVLKKDHSVEILSKPIYHYVTEGTQMLTGQAHPDYCVLSDRVYCAWKDLLDGQADSSKVLIEKADRFVRRCQYYGFERNVDLEQFFSELGQTSFFQEHANWNELDKSITDRNWRAVLAAKKKYTRKQRLSDMVHGVIGRRSVDGT